MEQINLAGLRLVRSGRFTGPGTHLFMAVPIETIGHSGRHRRPDILSKNVKWLFQTLVILEASDWDVLGVYGCVFSLWLQ